MGGVPSGSGNFASSDATNWKVIEIDNPWSDVTDAPVVPRGGYFAVLGGIKQQASRRRSLSGASEEAPDWLTPSMREMRAMQRGGGGRKLVDASSSGAVYSDHNYVATVQFYCERASVVCSGHGLCTQALPESLPGTQYPEGFQCACDEGWAVPSCAQEACVHPFNCVHGECQSVAPPPPAGRNTSLSYRQAMTGVGQATVCVCEDGWTTPRCDVAKCLDGCDADHGTCSRPNDCVCIDGWRGALCDRPETPIEALGELVRRNAPTAFGLVTSVSLVLATAVGCVTNYWVRRPKRLDAGSPLILRSRASSRLDKQAEMRAFASGTGGKYGGYGATGETATRMKERTGIVGSDSLARNASASGETLALGGGEDWLSEEAVSGGTFHVSMDHFSRPARSGGESLAADRAGFTPIKDVRTGRGAPTRHVGLPATTKAEASGSARRSSRAEAQTPRGGPGRIRRRGSQRAWLRADDRNRFKSAGGLSLAPLDASDEDDRRLSSVGSENSSALEQPTGPGDAVGPLQSTLRASGSRGQNPFGL